MADKKKTAAAGRKPAAARSASGRGHAGSSTRKAKAPAKKAGKTTVKKKPQAPSSGRQEPVDYALYVEIALWIVIAFAILIMISLFGFGGSLLKVFRNVFFGLFGTMAYPAPILMVLVLALLVSNGASRLSRIKAAGIVGLFITFCGFFQMILAGDAGILSPGEYFQAGAQYHLGGGWLGGILTAFFRPAIGVIGTYVVFLIMMLICLILLTQKSLFKGVKKGGSRVYQKARDGHEMRKVRRRMEEEAAQAEEAMTPRPDASSMQQPEDSFSILPREPRMNRRMSGVTTDTQLMPGKKSGSPAIVQEILKKPDDGQIDVPFAGHDRDAASADMRELKGPREPKDMHEPKDMRETREKKPRKQANLVELGSVGRGEEAPPVLKMPVFEGMIISAPSTADPEADTGDRPGTDPSAKREAEARPKRTQQQAAGEEAPERRSAKKPASSKEEIRQGIEDVEEEIRRKEPARKTAYVIPPTDFLSRPKGGGGGTREELQETARKLQQVFETFGVNVHITKVTCGPSVTRYELTPEMGVKVSKIVSLQDDIQLNLAASDIRIEAPIPGKSAIGIEVPNREITGVVLRELLESEAFRSHKSSLAYVVGKDVAGNIIVSDIAKMPHLLIAGATGSGKSVFINTLIVSLLYKASPDDVKLIMIDPKKVELSVYNGIPHLFIPVVTDAKKAAGALNWAVAEMMKRYEKFEEIGVRDLKGYNRRVEQLGDVPEESRPEKMPQIVIIVDELADLMMVASAEVEDAICRLAQLARAAGIHLVIATQRPSVDVITGLIKANMPSRIALSVSSGTDSRTILDRNGAEKLLGNGDMLFAPQQYKTPLRVQGAFVSDEEIAQIVDFVKEHNSGSVDEDAMKERMDNISQSASAGAAGGEVDDLFRQAALFVIEKDKATIGMLQRNYRIGFNRAARIMDQLADAGVVGPEEGTKPRKVLMSEEQLQNYFDGAE